MVLVSRINSGLLRRLANYPSDLERLTPRMFEELLAELLSREGWRAELTAETRDGGYDIIAARSVEGIEFQLLVQAKRFRKDRPVGVGVIRELYAVKQRKHASKAMLATTSHVSRVAVEEFRDVLPWELEFRGYDDLVAWIKKHAL